MDSMVIQRGENDIRNNDSHGSKESNDSADHANDERDLYNDNEDGDDYECN